MRTSRIMWTFVSALLIAPLVAQVESETGRSTGQQEPGTVKVRQVKAIRDVALAELLVPGDELVLVEPRGFRSVLRGNVALSLADDLDAHSEADIIVLAEASRSESFLADNDSWVRTKLTFRPLRIVKDAKQSLNQTPSTVTFYHDGGEVRINGVQVRAGYFYLYNPGERYLLFLRALGGDNNTPGKMQYRIDVDDRIAPMPMSNGRFVSAPGAFYGRKVDEIIEALARRIGRK